MESRHMMPPRKKLPLIVGAGVNLVILTGLYLRTAMDIGRFTYPLDDAYIHMGMARTLADTGTWGINPGEVASASSSPLWTVLLALAFKLFGAHELLPFVINALLSIVVVWIADRFMRRAGLPEGAVLPTLLALVLATPLPFIAGLGMEHMLQIAFAIALADLVTRERDCRGVDLVVLASLAGGATMTRYELAFLVGWSSILLFVWRRPAAALAVGMGGAAPLVAYALWSTSHGAFPIPNSILMKSAMIEGWTAGARKNLTDGAPVWFLVFTAAALQLVETKVDRRVMLFIATAVTHLLLARIGWLFRYEAWLIAWGIVTVAPLAARASLSHIRSGTWGAPAALLACALIPYGARAGEALSTYSLSARWTYDSDVQMAQYIARYWPASVVALHDIGAVSWYSDAEIVDVAGLATNEVTRLHIDKRLGGATIGEILSRRGVQTAWTDAQWLADDLPPGFSKVAEYRVTSPFSSKPWTAFVWAVDPAARGRLVATLSEFDGQLNGRATLVLVDDVEMELGEAVLEGPATQREPEGIAFYANGMARLTAPSAGHVVVTASGSAADGRGPRFTVKAGNRAEGFAATPERRTMDAGLVAAGDEITILYEDDLVDRSGNDRNLWIHALVVRP